MARIFTTPNAEQAAKAFLHQMTVAANLRTDPNISVGHHIKQPATELCNEVINRDFTNVDRHINNISGYAFYLNGKRKRVDSDFIAKCFVYLAELTQLYWDDTLRTPYEIDEFKNTILGDAVFKYGRYISAIKDKATGRSSGNQTGSSSQASSNGQPKNGYKQSGGQSSNVRDLKGKPGEKVYADGGYVYRIIGTDSKSKNIPNVFINPLSASGAIGSTNKVKFSSGNGYSDCTCFFDDKNEAAAFLNKLIQNNRIPANISNPQIAQRNADPNGYFIVGTEFGDCAISAKKLNEALTESANNDTTREASWEKATENYTREELEELHTWMRRG